MPPAEAPFPLAPSRLQVAQGHEDLLPRAQVQASCLRRNKGQHGLAWRGTMQILCSEVLKNGECPKKAGTQDSPLAPMVQIQQNLLEVKIWTVLR